MADAPLPEGATWRYPVLLACVGEGRSPNRSEFRAVARRIWREYLGRRDMRGPARFAALRRLLILPRAALDGQRGTAPRPDLHKRLRTK